MTDSNSKDPKVFNIGSKRAINVKRPGDILMDNIIEAEIQAKRLAAANPKAEVLDRKIQGAKEENALIREVGLKLRPEGTRYAGSFAVHIYQQPLSTNMLVLCQVTDLSGIPQIIAQNASNELTRHILHRYGIRAPKKLGEKQVPYTRVETGNVEELPEKKKPRGKN